MPTTFSGIGTRYYGKQNLEKEIGQCRCCDFYGELENYETALYVVVFYLPVLSLGRKQILRYCPSCYQYRVMPLVNFLEMKESAIESSTEQLAEKIHDPTAAIAHLRTLTAYRQWEDAKQLAPIIEKTHGKDVDVLLELGSWYELYGTEEDVFRCYDQAYKINPDHPGAKRVRVLILMQEQKLDEARVLLEDFQMPSEHYDPTMFFRLAELYQQNNRHAEALEIFDRLAIDNPAITKKIEMQKATRISEKAAGLKSVQIKQPSFYQTTWFGATVLLVAAVVFMAWLFLKFG